MWLMCSDRLHSQTKLEPCDGPGTEDTAFVQSYGAPVADFVELVKLSVGLQMLQWRLNSFCSIHSQTILPHSLGEHQECQLPN